jgi:hypothetical protein
MSIRNSIEFYTFPIETEEAVKEDEKSSCILYSEVEEAVKEVREKAKKDFEIPGDVSKYCEKMDFK